MDVMDPSSVKERAKKQQSSSTFGSPAYWERKYARELQEEEEKEETGDETFEWFHSYSDFQHVLDEVVDEVVEANNSEKGGKSLQILNVGAGNSRLWEDLRDDGYTEVVNSDVSPTLISSMREQSGEPERWILDDIIDSSLPDASLDIVLDKGTGDAVACSGNDALAGMAAEVHRLLTPNGVWFCLSHSPDRNPQDSLPSLSWSVRIVTIPKRDSDSTHDHIFILTKR